MSPQRDLAGRGLAGALRSIVAAMLAIVMTLTAGAATAVAGSPADYPAADSDYTSYAELTQELQDLEAAHPGILAVSSIGQSVEGRQIWIAKISDNVNDGVEAGEPEVLFDALHHAREHLTPEMALFILHLLVGRYGEDSDLGRRVTDIVDGRVTWIIFMLNPDGLIWDLTAPAGQRVYGPDGESFYAGWRKNRQDLAGTSAWGIDLNRGYGYKWGCCGGSSANPFALNYRGPSPWAAPEVRALRDFVLSRVIDGRQRITSHITFHTAGEQIHYPFGYTTADRPRTITALDQRTFVRMATDMAATNGYRPMQSSDLYLTDGDAIDWMYARQRIFSFTFELYPSHKVSSTTNRFYPPDELIPQETQRNRAAVLYLLELADCPYRAIGKEAAYCGPFFDDLEIDRGWTVDPKGSDTATGGRWSRGVPRASPFQRTDATSGQGVLVTGKATGDDVDGGRTTVRSPHFRLPSDGTATLRLRYWVGMDAAARAQDGFLVRLVDASGVPIGAPLLEVKGTGVAQSPRWRSLAVELPAATAGERVAIELMARDRPANGEGIVEAAVDAVRVTVE